MDNFRPIELNRRFSLAEVDGHSGKSPEEAQREAIEAVLAGRPLSPGVGWDELLRMSRVVILAEAGMGKTTELRLRTQTLRDAREHAFFCRMESIADEGNFCKALSPEDETRFREWLSGDTTGYFFLDSVDEAKLRDFPVDKALRPLARELGGAKIRARIFLSSRASEWDYVRDTVDFREHLGDFPKVAVLLPFDSKQQELFVGELGLSDGKAMLDAVRRAGDYLVNRPLDLLATSKYWGKHERIDSPMKMMEHSVSENLTERNPKHVRKRQLPMDKARQGAESLAAALTLCGDSRIRIPAAASERPGGVEASEVLSDWGQEEIIALLDRPVFDPKIYGAVRFHHRETREYLSARWFQRMLDAGASPLRVLSAFEMEKYGEEFVRPALRPVAAWLTQMNLGMGKFSRRMLELDPVALMSQGDPSVLPPEFREESLRASAKKIAANLETERVYNIPLERFGGADNGIAGAVNELLNEFSDKPNVVEFLLRIVREGKIAECADKALEIALSESDEDLRIPAIYAVADASAEQARILSEEAANRAGEWPDGVLIRAMRQLFPEAMTIRQFVRCVEEKKNAGAFGDNYLLESVSLDGRPPAELREFLDGILAAARTRSQRAGGWGESLTAMLAGKALLLLLDSVDNPHKDEDILGAIESLGNQGMMGFTGHEELVKKISADWRLVHALYWRTAEREGHANFGGTMWRLSPDPELLRAFVTDIREVTDAKKREEAFWAVWSGWQPYDPERADTLAELRDALASDEAMSRKLDERLEQAAKNKRRRKRQEAVRLGRERQTEAKKESELRESAEVLRGMSAQLCDFGDEVPAKVVRAFLYLRKWMESNNRPKSANESADERDLCRWESMIPVFGEEVARCARDGMMKFWRAYTPPVMSEIKAGRSSWSTDRRVSLGLFGLSMLNREQPDWTDQLEGGDAALAASYAMRSPNKFPRWMSSLIRRHSGAVAEAVRPEMEWYMRELPGNASPNILSPMLYSGECVGEFFALMALDILEENPLLQNGAQHHVSLLIRFLKTGDDVERRAAFYRGRVVGTDAVDERPLWLAEWMRVDAGAALEELERQLGNVGDPDAAKKFMTGFCGNLTDETRGYDARTLREAGLFDNVGNLLKALRLAFAHIRYEDDINRAGGGVYSPDIRDHAQDVRDTMLHHLVYGCSGDEAHRAMMSLSGIPELGGHMRGIMRAHARRCAEKDAGGENWTPAQVARFAKEQVPPLRDPGKFFQWFLSVLDEFVADMEGGDFTPAHLIKTEKDAQILFAGRLRDVGKGKFTVIREDVVADHKERDIRIQSVEGESVISIEMKIAENWSGSDLQNALKSQLPQYLRDPKTRHGILLLVYKGRKKEWEIPGKTSATFAELTEVLNARADSLAGELKGVDAVRVVGVDLSKAGNGR